jgi:hypothetical protein
MNRTSQRILLFGGIIVAVVIIALLAVIVVLLMGGSDDGSSETARVTATATSSPTPRATPRATPAATAPSSSHSPEPQQPTAAPTEATPPPGEQPAPTEPPSAPPANTAAPCPGPPTVAFFTANPATIDAGQSSTLDWGAVANATSVTVDQGIGAVEAPGARVVTPAATTIYTLAVTGCGGTIERQATVIVNPPQPTPTQTPPPGGGWWGIATVIPAQTPPPGGGSWGILTADLAVTGLNSDNLPQGKVWVTLANNGPDNLANVDVTLGCSGTAYALAGGTVTIATEPQTIKVSLESGWSAQFDTTISVDTTQYNYELGCTITVGFKDDVPANDSYTKWIP